MRLFLPDYQYFTVIRGAGENVAQTCVCSIGVNKPHERLPTIPQRRSTAFAAVYLTIIRTCLLFFYFPPLILNRPCNIVAKGVCGMKGKVRIAQYLSRKRNDVCLSFF